MSEAARTFQRVRTPTVFQMEAVECGAAALSMILGYHGRFVPLEQLRIDCGISRDGSKAANVVKAGRLYGLQGQGFRMEIHQLPSVKPPYIVFWAFSHFMVVDGIEKSGRVWVNDPETGPRSLSPEEFDRGYTGVILTFEPGPEFIKGGKRPTLLPTIRKRLQGSETAVLFVLLVSLALVLPGMVQPVSVRMFVDQILIQGEVGRLQTLLLALGAAAVVQAVLTYMQQHHLLRLETRLSLSTSSRFFWHVLRLPVEFYTQRYGGEIGSRVALNDRVAQLLSGQLATSVLNAIMVVFYAVVMLLYSVELTLVGIAIATINILVLAWASRRRKDGYRRLLQERGKLTATSMGGLAIMETLKATGSESEFFAKWAGCQAKVLNVQQRLGFYDQLLLVVPPALSLLTTVTVFVAGGFLVMKGEMTIGMLVAFQVFMASFLGPVQQLVGLGTSLQEAEGDMGRLDDVLNYRTDQGVDRQMQALTSEGRAESERCTRLTGHLELREVTFGYSRLEPPLIDKFSLVLKPGSRVALVGSTGSGKSTVSKLVTGLYDCWSGEVLFDGRPRGEVPNSLLTDGLALVDQEIMLFAGTVRDNLTLWDTTVEQEQIIRATRDADIHEEIAARIGDYESPVAEGGVNFSGGQRQRLEIARALVGDPAIVVLDEATSALDPIVEKRIDDNLRRRGCTCLIIAHRLSTIRDCDEIIMLERGKVVCRGTHDEMMAADTPYAAMVRAELDEGQ